MLKQVSSTVSIEESWLDHPIIQWILQNKKNLGYAAILLVLITILAVQYLSRRSIQTQVDYLQAEKSASLLTNYDVESDKREKALQDLIALLASHPEWQAKYEGLIAQTLINQNDWEKAEPYAKSMRNRLENTLSSYYQNYANQSLLIAAGQKEEALKQAYLLKDQMLKALKEDGLIPFGGTLYAFNLIRVALLEKDRKNGTLEKKAWDELNQIERGEHPVKMTTQEIQRVISHFDDKNAKLKTFSQGENPNQVE